MFWALQQLAGALSLAGERESLEAALNTFPALYRQALLDAFLARFGIASNGDENDEAMLRAFLAFMHATRLPWEAAIFDWFCGAASQARALQGPARCGLYR